MVALSSAHTLLLLHSTGAPTSLFPKQPDDPYRLMHWSMVKPFTWANVNIYGNSARRRKTQTLSQEQALYVMNLSKSAVSHDLSRQV